MDKQLSENSKEHLCVMANFLLVEYMPPRLMSYQYAQLEEHACAAVVFSGSEVHLDLP